MLRLVLGGVPSSRRRDVGQALIKRWNRAWGVESGDGIGLATSSVCDEGTRSRSRRATPGSPRAGEPARSRHLPQAWWRARSRVRAGGRCRKAKRRQGAPGGRRHPGRPGAGPTEPVQKVLGQERQIPAPRAQRRHVDAEDVQPTVEVVMEQARLGQLCEVAVSRRNQPDVLAACSRSSRSSLSCSAGDRSPTSSNSGSAVRGFERAAGERGEESRAVDRGERSPSRRLRSWTARAISCLPAPVSPMTSTGASLAAIGLSRSISRHMTVEQPTICSDL